MSRPFVFINVAMSVDGKIDTFERHGASISSPADKARVDRLRAGSDAVAVGGHTLLEEDPKLTVKSGQLRAQRTAQGLSENPMKVGVVTRATIAPHSNFLEAGPANVAVFTTTQTTEEQIDALEARGARVFVLGQKRVDLSKVLETLRDLGVKRLMVEGGATLNFELLRLGLVDEVMTYIAPFIFGGALAPTLAAGDGLVRSAAVALKLVETEILDEDGGVVLHYALSK